MPELWASVKKLRSHGLYCDGEAGFALDLHWIVEPRGSEHSTGSAVQVAVGCVVEPPLVPMRDLVPTAHTQTIAIGLPRD